MSNFNLLNVIHESTRYNALLDIVLTSDEIDFSIVRSDPNTVDLADLLDRKHIPSKTVTIRPSDKSCHNSLLRSEMRKRDRAIQEKNIFLQKSKK